MKRTYESGAAKRKKKRETEENLMKQKDSMLKFFKKPERYDDLKTIEENFVGRPTPNSSPSRSIDEFTNQKRDIQPEMLNKVEQRPTCSLTFELSLNEVETMPKPTCSYPPLT